MDATRLRRTRDCARQRWYAAWRCQRFARHLGFAPVAAAPRNALAQPTYGATREQTAPYANPEMDGLWELLLCAY